MRVEQRNDKVVGLDDDGQIVAYGHYETSLSPQSARDTINAGANVAGALQFVVDETVEPRPPEHAKGL